jgi:environmental stress-induced protein Ves
MRIVRAADLPRTPWKNGGGETAEIAVHPPGAGFADFGWRISLASVASDGSFSRFDGVDRTLTVLSGEMELTSAGKAHRLTAGSAPLAFPGDVPVAARLIGGEVTDLNVMTRRGMFEHAVEMIAAGLVEGPADDDEVCIAVALTDVALGGTTLSVGDGVVLKVGESFRLIVATPSPPPSSAAGSKRPQHRVALRILIRPAARPGTTQPTRDPRR